MDQALDPFAWIEKKLSIGKGRIDKILNIVILFHFILLKLDKM